MQEDVNMGSRERSNRIQSTTAVGEGSSRSLVRRDEEIKDDDKIWETTVFLDEGCRAWQDMRVEKNVDFVVEKNIEKKLYEELGISVAFHNIGFTNIAKVKGSWYPALVEKFYANMMQKSEFEIRTIDTMVQHHNIHIDEEDIADVLDITNWLSEGLLVIDFQQGTWANTPEMGQEKKKKATYVVDTAVRTLKLAYDNRGPSNKEILYNRTLDAWLKLCHFIICHNINPVKKTGNEVSKANLLILY